MFRAVAAAVAVVSLFAAIPASAQTVIGGVTVPAEQTTLVEDHCRELVLEADPGQEEVASATDPTGTGGTVTVEPPADAAAGTVDLSQITLSDCRDAGFYVTNTN